jgi:hypothetical protein
VDRRALNSYTKQIFVSGYLFLPMGDTSATIFSTLLPERSPSRLDLFVVAIAVFELVLNFYVEPSGWVWPLVVAGFVSCVLIAGPLAKTSVGRRLEEWFRAIGIGGRATLIVLFAVGWYLIASTLDIPVEPVASVANGIFLWIVVFVPLQIVYTTRFQEN